MSHRGEDFAIKYQIKQIKFSVDNCDLMLNFLLFF